MLSDTFFFTSRLRFVFPHPHLLSNSLELLIVVVESSHRGQTPCARPPVNCYTAPERAVIVFERLTFMMISFRLVITRDVRVSQLIGAVTSFLILKSLNVFFSTNLSSYSRKKGAVFSVVSNWHLIARVISECLRGVTVSATASVRSPDPSKRSVSG